MQFAGVCETCKTERDPYNPEEDCPVCSRATVTAPWVTSEAFLKAHCTRYINETIGQ